MLFFHLLFERRILPGWLVNWGTWKNRLKWTTNCTIILTSCGQRTTIVSFTIQSYPVCHQHCDSDLHIIIQKKKLCAHRFSVYVSCTYKVLFIFITPWHILYWQPIDHSRDYTIFLRRITCHIYKNTRNDLIRQRTPYCVFFISRYLNWYNHWLIALRNM